MIKILTFSAKEAWIGLEGHNVDTCQDAGCDGLLSWMDGTKFTFEPWMVGVDFKKRYNGTNYRMVINDMGEFKPTELEEPRSSFCQCKKSMYSLEFGYIYYR